MTVNCFTHGNNGTEPLGQNMDMDSCLFTFMLPNDTVVKVLICVFVMLTLLALTVNGYILFGVGSSKDLSWAPRRTLLKNLILSNLLQTVNSGPPIILALALRRTAWFSARCLLQSFVSGTCMMCSLITITFMIAERYLYVCHVRRYLVVLTGLRLRLAVSLTWVLSAFTAGTAAGLLLYPGRGVPGHALLSLLCEPDAVERHAGFPPPAVVFRKVTGGVALLLYLFIFSFSYLHMYQHKRNTVVPFDQVNTRARNTMLTYSGMLLLQLLPIFIREASDTIWKLRGNGAMTASPQTAGMSVWAIELHISLLVLAMVPPCVNLPVYGLRNWEVRAALRGVLWWTKADRPPSLDINWVIKGQRERGTAAWESEDGEGEEETEF